MRIKDLNFFFNWNSPDVGERFVCKYYYHFVFYETEVRTQLFGLLKRQPMDLPHYSVFFNDGYLQQTEA